jgi:ATP-dependent 26S proteasome regulatory subunit
MTEIKPVSLIIQEAEYSDVNQGLARINGDVMRKLGIVSGDYVKITGKKFAAAKALISHTIGSGSIAIDGNTRQTAGAGIGDTVQVEKIEPKTAAKITVQPMGQGFQIDNESLAQVVRNSFAGKVVVKGQRFGLGSRIQNSDFFNSFFGDFGMPQMETFDFIISDVSPGDAVIVGSSTEVSYKTSQYKGEDAPKGKSAGNIHYEDIGGLGRELSQVREMIEYPLRHPEVFEKTRHRAPKGCPSLRSAGNR